MCIQRICIEKKPTVIVCDRIKNGIIYGVRGNIELWIRKNNVIYIYTPICSMHNYCRSIP